MTQEAEITTQGISEKAQRAAVRAAFAGTALLGFVSLCIWLAINPALELEASLPGTDGLPDTLGAEAKPLDLAGTFEALGEMGEKVDGSWPWFRGANSLNVVTDAPPLAATWQGESPKVLWQVSVGEGFAAPSVLDGKVYLMDYDEENRRDALRCFSLSDGTELWRRSYPVMIKRNHGMSRTIPALTPEYIVTMGPRCHVVCLDTPTGDFRWGIDLKQEYGTAEPLWYAGQCPFIEDGIVILAPAGKDVLMMGVNCESGEVVWTTPNHNGWNMSHSSIIPMTLLGKKTYVYCALGGILGVSAEEADKGAILWERAWDAKVVAPSPVKFDDERVFITAGYGSGSMMLKVSRNGDGFGVETLFETEPDEGLACEQQSPIIKDGLLYGIMPKDAGALNGQFACYRPDGSLAWSSGADNRFGLGPFLYADNKFFIVDDDCVLTVLDATASEYKQLARGRVYEGHDAWGPLALAGSRLLMRDMNHMACVEIGAGDA